MQYYYFCIALIGLAATSSASRILFILPISTKSEGNLFFPIAKSLSLKGHEITYVTSSVPSGFKLPDNFKSIIPISPLQDSDFIVESDDAVEERKATKNKFLYLMSFDPSFIYDNCHKVYQNQEFQKILNNTYDLIFMSAFFNNCFNGLVHKFQVPFISLTSMPSPHWVSDRTGLRQPPSFVPVPLLDYSDEMDFTERFINTVTVWMFSIMDNVLFLPEYTKIYRHYLGEDYPDSAAIEHNVSLIMSNSHFALNFRRPTVPQIVEIGGIQCRPPKPLPKDLDDFLSVATHGVIYFSLGSVIDPTKLPEKTRKIIVNVFSKLKQRVLWKWNSEVMSDLPPKVKLSKWVPQQDVLGLPVFVDQDINIKQIEKHGYGLSLEIADLSEETLSNALNKLLTDPTYLKRAKEMSAIVRDEMETPLERATFWVEYVLRHKGAHHLKSPARLLNYFQYHSYDVIITILALLFIILKFISFFVKKICNIISSNFQKKSKTKTN